MLKEKPFEILLRRLRERRVSKYIPKGSAVGDLGCGFHGSFLSSISYKIKRGIGVDRNVKTCKRGNITYIRSDLETKLKLPSSKLDVVVILAVLEHLNNPEKLISEAYRLLRKKGSLIITVPSKLSKSLLEFLSFKLGMIGKEHIEEHKHYFSKSEIRNLCISAGFSKVKISSFEFGMNNLIVAVK